MYDTFMCFNNPPYLFCGRIKKLLLIKLIDKWLSSKPVVDIEENILYTDISILYLFPSIQMADQQQL